MFRFLFCLQRRFVALTFKRSWLYTTNRYQHTYDVCLSLHNCKKVVLFETTFIFVEKYQFRMLQNRFAKTTYIFYIYLIIMTIDKDSLLNAISTYINYFDVDAIVTKGGMKMFLLDVLPESTINIHNIFEDLIKSGYIKQLQNQNAFIILKTIEKNYSF